MKTNVSDFEAGTGGITDRPCQQKQTRNGENEG
jgi:hypothetical protein